MKIQDKISGNGRRWDARRIGTMHNEGGAHKYAHIDANMKQHRR